MHVFIIDGAFPGKCKITSVMKTCLNDVMKVIYKTTVKINVSQLDFAKGKSRELQNRTPNFMRQTIIVATPP